jgi:hypothetical protein
MLAILLVFKMKFKSLLFQQELEPPFSLSATCIHNTGQAGGSVSPAHKEPAVHL